MRDRLLLSVAENHKETNCPLLRPIIENSSQLQLAPLITISVDVTLFLGAIKDGIQNPVNKTKDSK